MTVGHTETRNRYDRPHSNLDWVGISGTTRSIWGKHLRNKNIPLNSLRAGVYVFKLYRAECNNNLMCAAKKYKGVQSKKTEHIASTLVNAYLEIVALEKARKNIGVTKKVVTPKQKRKKK